MAQDELEVGTEGAGMLPITFLFSMLTAGVLLVLLLAVVSPSLAPAPVRRLQTSPAQPQRTLPVQRYLLSQRTVVYLVSSQAEAASLDDALKEWRMELEALGTIDREPRRLVVVQTPDEVLHQRIIDFTLLAVQAPGLDFQVVDLRQ
jgi:hypothetical protein